MKGHPEAIKAVAEIIARATGYPVASQDLAEELADAGLIVNSGMLPNGDTFGDEDDLGSDFGQPRQRGSRWRLARRRAR